MSCTPISPSLANQFFSNDPTRLYGPIAKSLALAVPYIACLKSGTFPASVSAVLQSVAQGRPYLGTSMANPSFTPMLNLCGSCSVPIDQNGTNQYSYNASIANGISDKICLNQGFSAFLGSLMAQLEAYQEGIVELVNADIRWSLFQACGIKCVVQPGVSVASMISGGEYSYNTPVPAVEAEATVPFALLQALNRYLRTVPRCVPFGSGMDRHAKFIGSPDLLDSLRNDLGGAAGPGGVGGGPVVPLGYPTAGGNKETMAAITSYMFEPTYRGIKFGEDPQPLRLNWTGGQYVPVDPNSPYSATVGTVSIASQAWIAASHEVSFLMYDKSFERQVPAPWTGEGKAKFERQMFGGEIQFKNHPDMAANLWGDWGVMAWRIGRAYRPIYPWNITAIISKRCVENDNVVICTGVTGLT
jgi:hypothetical protein